MEQINLSNGVLKFSPDLSAELRTSIDDYYKYMVETQKEIQTLILIIHDNLVWLERLKSHNVFKNDKEIENKLINTITTERACLAQLNYFQSNIFSTTNKMIDFKNINGIQLHGSTDEKIWLSASKNIIESVTSVLNSITNERESVIDFLRLIFDYLNNGTFTR